MSLKKISVCVPAYQRPEMMKQFIATDTLAVVRHFGAATIEASGQRAGRYALTTRRSYLRERNVLRMLLKNYHWRTLVVMLPLALLQLCLEVGLWTILLKPRLAWVYVRAAWWNLRVLPATLHARSGVQSHRLISDRELRKAMCPGWGKLNALRSAGLGWRSLPNIVAK